MMPSCVLLDPASRADLQLACLQVEGALAAARIQAEAAVMAGTQQAAATISAGQLSFTGNIFVLLAAGMALAGVLYQVLASNKAEQGRKEHELKREALLPVAFWLGDVLRSVDLLGNVSVSVQDALEVGRPRSVLFGMQLACSERTVRNFFKVQKAINKMIESLVLPAKETREKSQDPGDEVSIQWAKRCIDARNQLIPPAAEFLFFARDELGIATDKAEYERLLKEAASSSSEIGHALLDAVLAIRKRRRRGLPPCTQ